MLMNFLNSWESAARGTSSTKITFFFIFKNKRAAPLLRKEGETLD